MSATIDFYFDFSSPYGYLAAQVIDALGDRVGRTVRWRPVLRARISHTEGVVIAMKRVEPTWKGSKSIAIATVKALSTLGGRFMATLGRVSGARQPAELRLPDALASRGAHFLDCRAPDTRAGPFGVRNAG